MKKHLLFLFGLIISTSVLAQPPQGISHQAVIRDAAGELITDSPIGIQVSILQGSEGGPSVYVERHEPESNANGLIAYVIGYGEVQEGSFEMIDWSHGTYFLKTEIDVEGGINYTLSGTTQLLSVPFALHAQSAEEYSETQTLADVAALNNSVNTQIKNLTDPTDAQDAATKAYVDLLASYVHSLLERIEALEEELFPSITVTDIDGNVYQTVIIGEQEWMTENLRVTRYNNGEDIPSGLSNTEWSNTTEGAYAIYPHGSIDGLDSDAEVVSAYGKLYNWYAVDDERKLCPEGWSVPGDDDWNQLVNYVVSQGFPNDNVVGGAGNALKSCRQVNSPEGGDCDTSEHPRWNPDDNQYGVNAFGFSALPGGVRWDSGNFSTVGIDGRWWRATDSNDANAWGWIIYNSHGGVYRGSNDKRRGFSVRCFREAATEPSSHSLNLEVEPENAGVATGAGDYQTGEQIEISAIPEEGWAFVEWTGDTDYVANPAVGNTTITMPAQDVWLTSNFQHILCDDGNLCTIGYLDPITSECIYEPIDCDDGNPCTDNYCDPAVGCITTYNNNPCDDGNACTTNNICVDGVCTGTPIDCDDGNPCTENHCDPQTGCYYVAIPDCIPCQTDEDCEDGVCVDDICQPE